MLIFNSRLTESVSLSTAAFNEPVFSNLDLLSFSTPKIVTSSGTIVLSPQYHASERICILHPNLFFEESAARFSMNSRTLPLQGFDAPNFPGGYLIDMWASMIDPENMRVICS